MCLSTVYKIEKKPENEVLKNVMLIQTKDGVITLTDIMGREEVIEGEIALADLTGGTVVVRPRAALA
ncbi:MAG: CooT family nickel-binding protein [Clostridia bacterium]|nr:CooT family nickel-binding protein [Clostridia bacterium]